MAFFRRYWIQTIIATATILAGAAQPFIARDLTVATLLVASTGFVGGALMRTWLAVPILPLCYVIGFVGIAVSNRLLFPTREVETFPDVMVGSGMLFLWILLWELPAMGGICFWSVAAGKAIERKLLPA